MPPRLTTESTTFTRDVQGRYVCNTFDEAKASTDTAQLPDARPFDIIIIGGGSFGAVLANRLFNGDLTHAHRILVIEAGPILLPEHVQNLPPSLDTNEVWGVPWNSDSPQLFNREFPGLAFCIGGRSIFWGGWSPYFIDSELPSPPWPSSVVTDLTQPVLQVGGEQLSYLDHASRQIGTDTTNEFIHGELHEALRDRLFQGLEAMSLNPSLILTGNRGALNQADDLEAPLAVQSASPRPGFFPFNKFNSVQLLIRAARRAQSEAEQSVPQGSTPEATDVKKRFMIAANTKLIRLERNGRRITRIFTNKGDMVVPTNGRVFLALGTIESTRVALATLPNPQGLIGRNLMAHLRSNVTVRIPRTTFSGLSPELQTSALFVKGIFTHADGEKGHFHIQITASGVGQQETNSEAELFKKIPDIDLLDRFSELNDQWIVITLRGIGEMIGDRTSQDPLSRITLDTLGQQGPFDYGQARALVRLAAGPSGSKDLQLWNAMDNATDVVAQVFAAGGPIQYLAGGIWQDSPPPTNARRDKPSTTHHEGGTLWMGEDPNSSVTDPFGLFHESDNLYALGPAVLPTLGSPNPMLSGVALSRRTGNHILAETLLPVPPEPGFVHLFDGTERTLNRWLFVGGGAFALIDGALVAQPGDDLGLLFYSIASFSDFTLRLQFRIDRVDDNSGVFVRSWDPRRSVPDRVNPNLSHVYNNKAYVAVDTGFEVQIDEVARPSGLDKHRTGAIYNIPTGEGGEAREQDYVRSQSLQPGRWYEYEIDVQGQTYAVRLDGQQVTTFTSTDTFRGKSASDDPHAGYIGLQSHTGRVAYRNIRIRVSGPQMLAAAPVNAQAFADAVTVVPVPASDQEFHADSDY